MRRSRNETATPSNKPSKWEPAIQVRQEIIRAAYLTQAEELERGTADDVHLARDIRNFVGGMPVPLTRQQLLSFEEKRTRAHDTQIQLNRPAPNRGAEQQTRSPQSLEPAPRVPSHRVSR